MYKRVDVSDKYRDRGTQRKRKEEGRKAKKQGEKRKCVTNVDKFKIGLDFLSIKAEKKNL